MKQSDIEHLRRLDVAEDEDAKQEYKRIHDRRDEVLTRVVIVVARMLLSESDYETDPQLIPEENNRNAVTALQDYLSGRSSIPEMEQRLLALVARGVLFGKLVSEDMVGRVSLVGTTDEQLDPVLVHRLARALDRSDEQEPLLWQAIDAELSTGDDASLIRTSIRLLLDEISISTVDESMEKMILDSIPGG